MSFQTHTLPNGIRLIHRKTESPVSHMGILINTGTRDEQDDEQGMAHFIEHTLFKGTQKRKSYHILNHLENVGGEINAYTTKEETCIYASFLNPYYARTLDLLSDICFNSVFPEKEIEKEKEIIYDEINQYKDSPSDLIFDEFENLIFEGHPMGRDILGNKKCIKNFTREKIFSFLKNNYHTGEMVVSSVGQIEMDKLVRQFEKYFGNAGPNLRIQKRIPLPVYKPKDVIVKRKNHQAHIVIGTTAYSYHDEKRTALALLNNILGGPGLNCKLNMNIREKYGFCYSIDSNYTPYLDTGVFYIYYATDNAHIARVRKLIMYELNKLKENTLSDLQFKRACNQLKGQLAIANESKLGEMLSIGKSLLVYNKVDTLDDIYKKIDTVTPNDLKAIAREIFDEANFSTLIFQNK